MSESPRHWWDVFAEHHEHAARCGNEAHHTDDNLVKVGAGIIAAILAVAQVQLGALEEQRKLRALAEGWLFSNHTANMNLVVRLVPKQGGNMPDPTVNPDLTQDVEFAIKPVNAAGNPTTGPFAWSISDGSAGTFTPAADGLSAKLVTTTDPAINIDVVVTVTATNNGFTAIARVQRTGVVVDNGTTDFGLTAVVVPKA